MDFTVPTYAGNPGKALFAVTTAGLTSLSLDTPAMTLCCPYPQVMSALGLEEQIAEVQTALMERCEELGALVADTIWRRVHFYPAAGRAEGIGEIEETCTANLRFIFDGLSPAGEFDTDVAVKTGVDDAVAGIPVQALMEGYRIGCQVVWEEIVAIASKRPHISKEALIRATARIWSAQDVLTQAATKAYHEETVRQAVAQEAVRNAFIEALFSGRVVEQTTLWEVATKLRLPSRGPYVVVAAERPALGEHALPEIASKLASFDIPSAWHLAPDVDLGLVHVSGDAKLESLKDTLIRITSTRIGVSSRFDDLSQVPDAVTYARIALTSERLDGSPLAMFDSDTLAIASVAAPQVMRRITSTVLAGFVGLTLNDRDTLFETFRTWEAAGGSVKITAERLFCHANTVRHRLKRIEKMSGKSLDHPRELAELCLAFEIDLRLP